MTKKTNSQLTLESLYLSPSKKAQILTGISLIKQTANLQNKAIFINSCLYLIWKFLRFQINLSLTTFLEILSDTLSKEQIKELAKNLKEKFEEINDKTLPSSIFDFLISKYDKDGNIVSIKIDLYKYTCFLLDTYYVQRINYQLSFWDGTEYKLGNQHLTKLIYSHKIFFEISTSFNEGEFISRYFEPIGDNKEVNSTQFIPLQNYDLVIDNNNPCIETTRIENKQSSRLVTNALKIRIPSNDKNDFTKWTEKCRTNEIFKNFINQITCGDRQLQIRIAEVLGNLLVRGALVKEGALTFLYGKMSSGKSTLLNLTEKILGKENCCSINPNNFGERFDLQDAPGKAVDFVHESIDSQISEKAIAKLKSIVTNDPITVEAKYETASSVRLYLKIIFACNNIPPIKWDEAFIYRLQIIPFNASFPDSSVSNELSKDQDFLNALFVYALDGFYRLKKNGKFSQCEACDKALEKYKIALSPLNEYLSLDSSIDIILNDHSGKYLNKAEYEKFTVSGMYSNFRSWAEKNGYYPKRDYPSSRQFQEAVLNKFQNIEIKKGNFYYGGHRSQDLVFSKKISEEKNESRN